MKLHTMGRTLGAHRRPGLMVVAVVLMALGLGMGWFVVQQHTAALQERGKTAEWYVSQYPAENRRWLPESQLATTHQLRSAMAIYEVTQYPHATEATQAQRRPAEALVQRSRAAAERKGWFRFEKALQDGFELMFEDTVHFANKAFIADNRILDPERPEFLMYYDTPQGKRLAGYMYLVRTPEERGRQVGGPLTVWHYHVWRSPLCLLDSLLVVGKPNQEGRCASGIPTRRSPEMLHVWFLDHPKGPFSTDMLLTPDVIRQLAEK